MDRSALEWRFPQIAFDDVTLGVFEPGSGVLMARRAVAAVVEDAVKRGAEYRLAQIATPRGSGLLDFIFTSAGGRIVAGQVCFCLGAWRGETFSGILRERSVRRPPRGRL